MLWFIFLFFLGNAYADIIECYAREVYSECNGDCDSYCNWSNGTVMRSPCSDSCQPGCVCKNGYIRRYSRPDYSECIRESHCISCPVNEHYTMCWHHCQDNCRNRDPPCPRICVPGCVCNTGYIRKENDNSPCIPIEECPNELF